MGPEDRFKHSKVIPGLKEIPDCNHFIKEAGSIRGVADIIGNVNGHYFAWEIKKSFAEAQKTKGRIALQRYRLEQTIKNGGIGRFVYPENLEECLDELWAISSYEY